MRGVGDARPREVAETVEIAAPLVDTLSLCRLTVPNAVGWLTYIGLLHFIAAVTASLTHTVMSSLCVFRDWWAKEGLNQATHTVSTAELSHLCC